MCAALALLSPLLGRALVAGASREAKNAAVVAVAILAGAAWCQIWSAGLSAVLAASQRFVTSALLYAAAGLATVVLAAALMPLLGVAGAALGLAGSAIGLLTAHAVYLRRFGFAATPSWSSVRTRAAWRLVGVAAAGGAAPLAFQVTLSIALAGASGSSTGAVTAYTYGYLLAALLSGVTAATLGFTTMPQLVLAVRDGAREAIDGYMERISAFSVFLFLAPAAGYAALGRPLVGLLLEGPLSTATVDRLWDISRVFLLMALVWALLAPVTPLALALGRLATLALLSAAIVPAAAVLVLLTHRHGPTAVAVGHAACAAMLPVLVLVALFGRDSGRAVRRIVRAAAPAGALALVYPALAALGLDGSIVGALLGLAAGTALYLGLAVKLWPSVGGHAVRLLRHPTVS
jgi:peptidoglycan biosynthesis protein MviN/MurJ (putative lipid II flippase)